MIMSPFGKVEMSSKITHSKGVCDEKREDLYGEGERVEAVKST